MIIKETILSSLMKDKNWPIIKAEYSEIASIKDPYPNVVESSYVNLERSGMFKVFGAYEENELLGYITLVTVIMPHYAVLMSNVESFYVIEKYRSTGAGNKLRSVVRNVAKELGSYGLIYTAPIGSILEKVLESSKDCVTTSKVFYEKLK